MFKKIFSLCLAATLMMAVALPAFAAEPTPEYLIDESAKGSLTIYKYDLSRSEKDGVWNNSYVSTGVYDETVNNTLGGNKEHTLGNGETSYGYAIKGVGFTYAKIADIVQTDEQVGVLYGIPKTTGADFLKALGLENGSQRDTTADVLDEGKYFYQSDVLVNALASKLESNSTVVKNAMETYLKANGGKEATLTDAYGKTKVTDLELGLYLVAETTVPEMVVSSINPFLVSVPMTTVNGTNATNGGTRWNYDITLYPKNLTGDPTLEKTLKEAQTDTGKTENYTHTGTASAGDAIDYQIISTLPSITSQATYLSAYTFEDALSKGLSYKKGDVEMVFFKDAACTQQVAAWNEASGKFSVAYNPLETGDKMTISMTAEGLKEINSSKAVYAEASMLNSGFSGCTVRIRYQATVNTDGTAILGDAGNPNTVQLTWKRTSSSYYNTLEDDCHVYTYAMDLTKRFSDGQGNFANVEFIVQNKTDGYYVTAAKAAQAGVYTVTGHTADKEQATHFVPADSGKILVQGLEDDSYIVTEFKTDNGYVLLKKGIQVVISQQESSEICKVNQHHLLTASATVDNKQITMQASGESQNAIAPFSVVNTKGFNLPETGDNGTLIYTVVGFLLMAGAGTVLAITLKKKKA